MDKLNYAFTWLTEGGNNMFGQMQLEQFTGLTSMPQKAASAWDGAFSPEMVGVTFKPLLYLGSQTKIAIKISKKCGEGNNLARKKIWC